MKNGKDSEFSPIAINSANKVWPVEITRNRILTKTIYIPGTTFDQAKAKAERIEWQNFPELFRETETKKEKELFLIERG